MSNSKILSNMSNMMTQMRKMLQEISKILPPREEVMHGVPKFNLQDTHIIVDHPKLNNSTQKDFGTGNHRDELNIVETVSDPIDEAVSIDLTVTTNTEFQPILSENVNEMIHFSATFGEVLAKEVEEFDLFLVNNGSKAQANKASRDIKKRNFDAIIPSKMIWGWLSFGTKWLTMWISYQ
ncbi:hypothetical protein J1N35_041312 [Gossypium stocksii]|uniref:Uncharacterized protein n=1 Tax=Gossypium stocksii TaxID=47602 RepID=A0A9D3ZJK9_9ROSI|nr:hypothetical protein J1N35_041312 [Gossypium stocksii]